MKILVTGAGGVLGCAIRQADASDHEFVLLDVNPQIEADGGIRGTFTDRDTLLQASEGCDTIIHTAAMHGAWIDKATDERFITTNVAGTATLFHVAKEQGIRRVVCSSTMEILVGRDWRSYGTCVLDESFEPRPESIYSVTKRQVEILGSYFAQNHGLEVIHLRYMGFTDQSLEDWGYCLAAKYLHADDVATANLAAATRPGLRDEIFNIGPQTPLNQRDIQASLTDPWPVLERYWPGCRLVLEKHDLIPNPEWFYPVTRIDKACHQLGWRPHFTFGHWLRTLGWRGTESFKIGDDGVVEFDQKPEAVVS